MFRQFFRTGTCRLGLLLVLALGFISILTGKQFLDEQEKRVAQVAKKYEEHIARNVKYHHDDLGLLLYYLKFPLVKAQNPLTALSIGQNDLNPNIQSVKILTLEGQKYDTDLVNPAKLLVGNLDLNFILVHIFPLLIIAFTYNLLSEEEETGTWKMVSVAVKSKIKYLLSKLLVRMILLLTVMGLLFLAAGWALNIPLGEAFFAFFVIALLYQLFWFALSFWVVSLRRHSNFNAVVLLSFWLCFVILFPAIINSAVTSSYPVPEAFSTIIKQRDGYHQKWDANKRETMEKFYKSYPQFEKYGCPPEQGFSWLWYYAMQHLGDAESREESKAMRDKILQRQRVSRQLGQFFPSMHTSLAFNNLAGTSLLHHMNFLQRTHDFHENTRLYFYPMIFSRASTDEVEWERLEPIFYTGENQPVAWWQHLVPLFAGMFLFVGLSALSYRRKLRHYVE